MAAKILVIAWAAWLALPLATGHLNVLISQAEVMKLLGKFQLEYLNFEQLLNLLLSICGKGLVFALTWQTVVFVELYIG